MRPLRIKASGSPITATNYQGLQEMTDVEINQYLSYVITNKFADDSDGTGVAELNVDTANALTGTAIGTFADTIRNDAIGTHPTAGAVTTTTYYFKQVSSSAAVSITNRIVGYDAAIKEMTNSDLNTDILDKVIEDMVTETAYTVGQYKLSATSPAGGTWTSRYTITDSTQGGNTVVYLWQKTAPTSSANADLTSLKLDSTNVKGMTSAEIEQIVPNFRNRIISSEIGTYKLQASAPGVGTYVQMGDALTDTRQVVSSQNYSGTYTGAYATNYTASSYSGTYTGNYVGTSAYAGAYSGAYAGAYNLFYAGFAAASFTGYYTGYYTGFYTGPKTYTGYYTGDYAQTYTGYYVGTSTFSGTYTATYTGYYSGNYTGVYAGDTIQASTEVVSTVKLWIKTA